jgi:outer membrane protein assembly factor BamE
MRIITLTLFTFIFITLTACSFVKPYQVDVQQGNIIDKKVLEQIHLGMDKDQVTNILGAPLLNYPFGSDTWEYVYTNQVNGGKIVVNHLRLEFKNGKLTKFLP